MNSLQDCQETDPKIVTATLPSNTDSIGFYDKNQKEIGTLYLEPPMRFEGDAEESAKIFFEFVLDFVRDWKEKEGKHVRG